MRCIPNDLQERALAIRDRVTARVLLACRFYLIRWSKNSSDILIQAALIFFIIVLTIVVVIVLVIVVDERNESDMAVMENVFEVCDLRF